MKFVLLVYDDEAAWATKSEAERASIFREHAGLYEHLLEKGAFLAGEQLEPSQSARTVRTSGSGSVVADGPCGEAREQLGGFYLLDAADMDQAIDYAKRLSGTVEVRPVAELEAGG